DPLLPLVPVKCLDRRVLAERLACTGHMKGRRQTITEQGIAAVWGGNEIDQARAVLVLKDQSNFLEAVVYFPAGSFTPHGHIARANDTIGSILIPVQRNPLVVEVGPLARRRQPET